MKKFGLLGIVIFFAVISSFALQSAEKFITQKAVDGGGYSYEFVSNDPMKVRIYTLKNGLQVWLRQNADEPRIQTLIAVKAGSTYDPPQTTGLAHYLEHMMFKGSNHIGTTNWDAEEKLISEISGYFQQRFLISDTAEKKRIYAKIDSVSQLASKYAIANEYDKMMTSIGAKGTNASTSDERTVYVNDIPANEFEKWLKLESERFNKLVLRLFHTELETVYEEFNMYQDYDWAKASDAMRKSLFQKHPYGTQTTIGRPEHLKNPSMENIQKYWSTYYVPNNMAICLSGDIDFEKTVKLIDKYFGSKAPGNVPKFVPPVENPIAKPIVNEVLVPESENLSIGWRICGFNDREKLLAVLIDYILNNAKAGLIDLDLVQKQKVLEASSGASFMHDYGTFELYGKPREGQKLEEVRDLLFGEIEKLKKGEFDDWLVGAIINDFRLNRIRQEEYNYVAYNFVSYFSMGAPWLNYVKYLDNLETIKKQDIVAFANKYFIDDYAIVYKRTGKDTTAVKVDKPAITPLKLDRETQSEFLKQFTAEKSESLKPVFVDYQKSILKQKLGDGIEMNYIKNVTNELFSLSFIIDMGGNNDLKIPLAVEYLPFIGTSKFSPEDLRKEFFKLGVNMSVYAADDRCYVSISGLEKNFEKGLELIEQVLADAKPDNNIYNNYIENIIKQRADAKLDKESILWNGLLSYGMYGKQSPFTHILQEAELKKTNPNELTDIVKNLFTYKHYCFYYGNNPERAAQLISKYHKTPKTLKDYPPETKFKEMNFDKNTVYFVNYDMTQTNILLLTKDVLFDKNLMPDARLFGEFYGSGLSSIVFQEIREAKGLAYTAFASYSQPDKPDKSFHVYSYVGTQPDKMKTALDAIIELMNKMPKADKQFDASRISIMKKIESERITKSSIFWNWLRNNDMNIKTDIRSEIYEKMKNVTISDFEKFFESHIKGKKYAFLVIGNKQNVDLKLLEQYGEVKEMNLDEIFNY